MDSDTRRLLSTALLLVVFAVVGIGSRIGLDELAEVLSLYNWNYGSSYSSVLSNCVGCFLLGFLSQLRSKRGWFQRAGSGQLYLCLSTGLCGSLTTFSGWIYASSWVLTNTGDSRPSILEHIIDSIGILVVGYALSVVFFRFGQQLVDVLPVRTCSPADGADDTDSGGWLVLFEGTSNWVIGANALVLGVVLVPLAVCLAVVVSGRGVCLSMIFGPLGALLRWQLAVRLNGRIKVFPLGTFIANLAGTLLYNLMCVAMGLAIAGGEATVLPSNTALQSNAGWLFLQATLTGFCGALTTMSTFVSENEVALPTQFAYLYLLSSVLLSYSSLLLINGLYFWMANQPSVVDLFT